MSDQRPLIPSRFVQCIATSLSCLLLFAVLSYPKASAQKPGSAERGYVLRTYEVGDLVLTIQDHPYSDSLKKRPMTFSGGGGGGFGRSGGGGGGAKMPANNNLPTTTGITMDGLMDAITTTAFQDSWARNGNHGEGQIVSLGTALVVSHTQEVHAHIEALLHQIRKGSANRKTLTIDARWLLLDSDELESLLLPNQKDVPQVDREVLAEFTRRPSSIRGITNCFSNQLVYLISGTKQNAVSSFIDCH